MSRVTESDRVTSRVTYYVYGPAYPHWKLSEFVSFTELRRDDTERDSRTERLSRRETERE